MAKNIMIAKDPAYNEDGSIDLILIHPTEGEIPFTARHSDPEEHGRFLFEKAMAGAFGPIKEFKEAEQ